MGPTPKCHFVPKLSNGSFEIPKIGTPTTLEAITLCVDLRLKWGLKQRCSPHWELSNEIWHATYTQEKQGDSQLLVVENQIGNLTPGPSFGHNLCFNFSNGSCEPILDIYVPKAFQWYEELFNPMGFDPGSHNLKIWESIGTLTPEVGVHLRVWKFIPSHSPTLPRAWNVTPKLHSWPAPLQALILITNLRLGLQHQVITIFTWNIVVISL